MEPGWQDWALLIGSGVFTLAGLAMLFTGDEPGTALAVTAFFGLCTAIALWFLLQKAAIAWNARAGGEVLAAPGRIPESHTRILVGGATLLLVGSLMVYGGGSFGWVFQGLSALMAGTGLALVLGLASGLLGHRWLRFERQGLRIGSRHGSYLVPWDAIEGCDLAEISSNPMVRIAAAPPVLASTAEPPDYASDVLQACQKSLRWQGAPVVIFPMHFALDAGLLLRSIRGYAEHPERREELTRPA